MKNTNLDTKIKSAVQLPTYLFVVPWSLEHTGGVNQVIINLAQQMLIAGKLNPLVLIIDWNAKQPIYGKHNKITTVRWRIPSFYSNMTIKQQVAYYWWKKTNNKTFQHFVQKNRIETINPHYPTESSITLDRLSKQTEARITFNISFHGTDIENITASSDKNKQHWFKHLNNVDNIIVCSNDLGDRVKKAFINIGKLNTTTIYNGISVEYKTKSNNGEIPKEISEHFILCVAKYTDNKGINILIDSFSLIIADHPDFDLVLIGAEGPARSHLKMQCDKNGLSQKVHFFVNKPNHEVSKFYRKATILVLPSLQEAFGIVLLEAGVFGLPVIASRVGGIPEIINTGSTGYLVDADNVIQLADTIGKSLKSPTFTKKLGLNLKKHVVANYSLKTAYIKYIKTLKATEI